MDLIKRHLFFILCGVAGLVGIVLAVTGTQAMPAVMEQLDEAAKLYQDLSGLRSKGANERMLETAQERIDRILADRNAIGEKANVLYPYEPLVADVFPDGDADARRAFRTAYGEQMAALMLSLNAGMPATPADIQAMAGKISDEAYRRKLLGETEPADPGPAYTPAGVLTRAGARVDPTARAHIAAAQRIYCYAVDYATLGDKDLDKSSLDFDFTMQDTGTVDAPEPTDVWWAQVKFWLQRDIVNAIVSLNEEAAAEAKKNKADRWVAIMPVKEIISIRFSNPYVQANDDEFLGNPPGGYTPAYPPAAQRSAFTHSASDDFVDVMQFSIKLVMDQRDILKLVSRLTADRFHTPLRIAYKAIPPNRKMVGKIYGPEPAVNVVMDFETPMLAEIFRKWMPPAVCEELEISCPGVEEAGTEG